MDNYFHFQVNMNPVEKFNKLATHLSTYLRDKSRQATRRFNSAQKRFFLKEKEILRKQAESGGSQEKEDFLDLLKQKKQTEKEQ